MKKPEWINKETLVEITNHPKEEIWIEEHENDLTGEHVFLVIDTSGCDEGICGIYSSFEDASNVIGEQYGFNDLWVKFE